jgi:hypothetical protein
MAKAGSTMEVAGQAGGKGDLIISPELRNKIDSVPGNDCVNNHSQIVD